MIDAERILSSLVRNALTKGGRRGPRRGKRGRGRSGVGRSLLGAGQKGALALGALGVAIAAFENFTKARSGASKFDGPPPPPPAKTPHAPGASIPPPPPPPTANPTQEEALLLVRAMIAAAHADHQLDDRERARILEALDASGLDDEERGFLLAELETPLDPASLAAQAGTGELARQVYLASLMAIEVDTPAEREYLARLAGALALSPSQVAELEQFVHDAK